MPSRFVSIWGNFLPVSYFSLCLSFFRSVPLPLSPLYVLTRIRSPHPQAETHTVLGVLRAFYVHLSSPRVGISSFFCSCDGHRLCFPPFWFLSLSRMLKEDMRECPHSLVFLTNLPERGGWCRKIEPCGLKVVRTCCTGRATDHLLLQRRFRFRAKTSIAPQPSLSYSPYCSLYGACCPTLHCSDRSFAKIQRPSFKSLFFVSSLCLSHLSYSLFYLSPYPLFPPFPPFAIPVCILTLLLILTTPFF